MSKETSKPNSKNLEDVDEARVHKVDRVARLTLLVDVLLSCLTATMYMEKSTKCQEVQEDLDVEEDVMHPTMMK